MIVAPTASGTSGIRPRSSNAAPNARAATLLTTVSPANRAAVQTSSWSATETAAANNAFP